MADEVCNVCGSPVSSHGREDTALAQHILDHDDPHQTLALVPSIELGMGPPSSAQGHKQKDLYIDLEGQRIYVASGTGGLVGWLPASSPVSVTTAYLNAALSGYVTTEALGNRLAGYVQSSTMSGYARVSDLAAYATLSWVQDALQGYVQASRISEFGFINASSLASALSAYVTQTSLSSLLSTTYLSQTTAASTYATKAELSNYVLASALPASVAGRVYRSPTSPGVYPELDLDVILQGYLTKALAASTYVTPAWLQTNGYVDSAALSAALSAYVTGEALTSALEPYLTRTVADERYLRLSDYETPPSVPPGIMGAVLRSPLSPGVYPELNLDVILQGYLTKTLAASTYVTQASLMSANYVSASSLSTTLGSYVLKTGLATELGSYYTKAEADARYLLLSDYVEPSSSPAGMVRRAPTSPGVYPELNLDIVLRDYLTKSEASGSYVTQTRLSELGYLDAAGLATALASYVSSSDLVSTLNLYLSKAEAISTYVTPAYLTANGYVKAGDSNQYVFRSGAGAELNLDTVLASWPSQIVGPTVARPPAGSAVYAALLQRDASIDALQTQVNNLSVTGGQSCVMNVVTLSDTSSVNVVVPANDKSINTIVIDPSWVSVVLAGQPSGTKVGITVSVPDAYQNSTVARDFVVVLDFAPGSGRVPVMFNGFITRLGGSVSAFSYTSSGLYSLEGVAYGMKVAYALTEMRPGVLAVTRKNLYEV